MERKLIRRSRLVQIVAITAILGGLHSEQVIDIGTPGKDNLEAFKAGLKDLVAMIKSGKFGSKALRAKFAQVIAQLQQAIAACQAAQEMAPWAFSDANYNSVFTAVQALGAYARKNGISLVEENPLSKVVRSLNAVLVDCGNQGWYEQVLVATHTLFADIQSSTNSSAREFQTPAITFVGFEPMTQAETEAFHSQAETAAPAAPALVATSGETIDRETPQEDYSKVGYNARQAQ